MGGNSRRPIKLEKPKPRLKIERLPNVAPGWIDLEELAFGKRKVKIEK